MKQKIVMKALLALAATTVAAPALAAERLAECKIFAPTGESTVLVDKYPGGLPADEVHLTPILQVGDQEYQVAEAFDGKGQIGIGRGTVGSGISFDLWANGKLPLSLVDLARGVSIFCAE